MADVQSLIHAAGAGDTEAVRSILSAGLDVNTAKSGGETALIRAAGNGHAEAVRLLLSMGRTSTPKVRTA
ncbi:MAG: ankyrin repeat domain-containing protein [Pyrinomonadaceae bacterium]